MKSETSTNQSVKKNLTSLKRNTKKIDVSRLIRNELNEKNTTQRSAMEFTTKTNIKPNSQNSLRSRADYKNNNEKSNKRRRRKRQRKCFITPKLSRKCIGLKSQRKSDVRQKLIGWSSKTETRNFDLLQRTIPDPTQKNERSINQQTGKT